MSLEELLILDAEAEAHERSLEFFVTGCSGFIGTHWSVVFLVTDTSSLATT